MSHDPSFEVWSILDFLRKTGILNRLMLVLGMKELPQETIDRVVVQKYSKNYSGIYYAIPLLYLSLVILVIILLLDNKSLLLINSFLGKGVINFNSSEGKGIFFFVNFFGLLLLGDALIRYMTNKFAPQKYKDYTIYWNYTFYRTKADTSSVSKYTLCAGIFIYIFFVAILFISAALK